MCKNIKILLMLILMSAANINASEITTLEEAKLQSAQFDKPILLEFVRSD